MKININIILKRILPVIVGGLLGFGYYYFIGCNSGGCAITSNPYISTAYGAFFGFILALPRGKNSKSNSVKNHDDDK
jgi:hypothetical protein